ncbi:hypothetical protein ANANG_G00085500 [Anguilla anguilla]|uniref:Uncharacterized protein n=1 Tax=Anguilla anguilla TaxID=7936 RepID=A0A9D3MKT9_ANGAN|nr:hypothetical protein ANANG_G00085500 [Anguilla anguilla]
MAVWNCSSGCIAVSSALACVAADYATPRCLGFTPAPVCFSFLLAEGALPRHALWEPFDGRGQSGASRSQSGGVRPLPAGIPEYPHPSFSHSVNLQRNSVSSWQPAQHQEAHASHIGPGVPDGGCAFSAQTSPSCSPAHSSLNLSIKSERLSPEHTCSPATPPLHHMMHHSPISSAHSVGSIAQEPYAANEREGFHKGTYPAQHNAAKAQSEDKTRPLTRRLEIEEGWPR